MDIQNLSKVAQTGVEGVGAPETKPGKEVGKASDFEKLRLEKLEQEEQVTGLKADQIQYNENLMSHLDVKQVQNDFMRQVQQRGEGKELEVLSEHIAKIQGNLDKTRTQVPTVEKSELGGAVENYFKETENRFNTLDSLYKEISAGDRQYSMQDLLKIQVQLNSINQNIEMVSKVVDRVAEGMKTLLKTQV